MLLERFLVLLLRHSAIFAFDDELLDRVGDTAFTLLRFECRTTALSASNIAVIEPLIHLFLRRLVPQLPAVAILSHWLEHVHTMLQMFTGQLPSTVATLLLAPQSPFLQLRTHEQPRIVDAAMKICEILCDAGRQPLVLVLATYSALIGQLRSNYELIATAASKTAASAERLAQTKPLRSFAAASRKSEAEPSPALVPQPESHNQQTQPSPTPSASQAITSTDSKLVAAFVFDALLLTHFVSHRKFPAVREVRHGPQPPSQMVSRFCRGRYALRCLRTRIFNRQVLTPLPHIRPISLGLFGHLLVRTFVPLATASKSRV